MDSTNYQNLSKVANLTYADTDEQRVRKALGQVQQVQKLLNAFREDPGMAGLAADAILEWTAEFQEQLKNRDTELQTMVQRHELARKAMRAATAEHAKLSPTLVAPFDKALRHNGPFVVDGVEISGSAYLSMLRNERNAEREAAARRILQTMNDAVKTEAEQINEPIKQHDSKSSGGSSQSGGGSSTSGGTSGGPGGVSYTPPSQNPSHLIAPVGPLETPAQPPRLQERLVLIPNGPPGGYIPPSVLNPNAPEWTTIHVPGTTSNPGQILGGVVGGGSALGSLSSLRRGGARGLTPAVSTALRPPTGPGSSAGLVGSTRPVGGRAPSGGIVPPAGAAKPGVSSAGLRGGATPGAAQSGAAKSGAAGMRAAGLRGGATPGAAQSGAGKSGAAGMRAAGLRGGATPGAAQPTGGSKGAAGVRGGIAPGGAGKDEDRKKRKAGLIGYVADQITDDDVSAQQHESTAAGSAQTLSPIVIEDEGERW